MCVIAVKPAGFYLSEKNAKACFEANNDGAGFAWAESGKVHISKGYFTFEEFWTAYRDLESRHKSTILIHFRVTTAGLTNADNCHPFRIREDLVMAHNGMIGHLDKEKERSDTRVLVEDILTPLADGWPDFYQTDSGRRMLEVLTGGWNKLAFIDGAGDVYITNAEAWEKYKGILYSNLYWRNSGRYGYASHGHEVRPGVTIYQSAWDDIKTDPHGYGDHDDWIGGRQGQDVWCADCIEDHASYEEWGDYGGTYLYESTVTASDQCCMCTMPLADWGFKRKVG